MIKSYVLPSQENSNQTSSSPTQSPTAAPSQSPTQSPTIDSRRPPINPEELRLHSQHMDILDLLAWELASLEGIRNLNTTNWTSTEEIINSANVTASCAPPPGVSTTCCLGTFSEGGGVHSLKRYRCAEAMKGLDNLESITRAWFQENPIPSTEIVKCDVCKIVQVAREYNLTIALMGDSMQSQVIEALECELARRNYHVSTELVQHNVTQEGGYQRKHYATKTMKVRSPTWVEENDNVTIKFHIIYRVPLVKGGGDFLALTAEADVVVLGFGLHWWYDEKVQYSTDMTELFQSIKQQGHVQLLVHRETTAQHFDASGGEYLFWAIKPSHSPQCQEFQLTDESVYWREKAIANATLHSGHRLVPAGPNMTHSSIHHNDTSAAEVVSLPYFYFTSKFANMHPSHWRPGDSAKDSTDCTHYCGSPFIYYSLWRSLRFAMDHRFGREKR